MVGGKSSLVDELVCTGIETNIDGFSDGRTDILNSSLSGVTKKHLGAMKGDRHMGKWV